MDATKAALVTGGTAGIGLATAQALAAEGRRVYVTGRSADRLKEATDAGLIGIPSDMATAEGIRAVVERIAADGVLLDVLVANAGTAGPTVLGQTDEAGFDRIFDLNVRSLFFTVQSLLPYMADGASIVLIGSILSIKGTANYSVYSASKAAVRSFARSWANDLRDRRIRVNTVSPGPVVTPLTYELHGSSENAMAATRERIGQTTPAGRIAEPGDIASVVRFLASSEAAYVNGIEMFVDGGGAQI